MVKINDREDFNEISPQEEKISVSDMKKKEKFSHITFHGNPKRLMSFIKNDLDNNGYDVKYDALDTKEGGFGQDVSDVSLRVYAEKRKDIKGKIKKIIPRKVIFLTLGGIALLLVSYLFYKLNFSNFAVMALIISLLSIGAGIFFIVKGPKQKLFSYYPSSSALWVVGEGEAFFGSKTQESKSGHSKKAGSSNAIKTAYLTSDMDVHIAAATKSMDRLYREKLLKDKEKLNPSFFYLAKCIQEGIGEVSMENEEAYNGLPSDKETHKKHISSEMEDFSKKLNKFMGVD